MTAPTHDGVGSFGGTGLTLRERYDGLVCDLDGVVYRGPDPVEYAVDALGAIGDAVVFATNNASRPPADVARHLVSLGLAVDPHRVVTSSQAGARRLREVLGPGRPVVAIGGEGVVVALEEAGLVAVRPDQLSFAPSSPGEGGAAYGVGDVVAVLQGYGLQVTADDLARASYVIEAGACWVATNTDATLPTDRGVAPGNGMLVAAVARATGVTPEVVGKPEAPLYDLACERLGSRRLLGVGDRLDTDILGAAAAGLDSLWLLTGVDDLGSFAGSPGRPSPTWVAPDLRALAQPVDPPRRDGDAWWCGEWGVRRAEGVSLEGMTRTGEASTTDSVAGDVRRRTALLSAGVRLLCEERDERGADVDRMRRLAGALEGVAQSRS